MKDPIDLGDVDDELAELGVDPGLLLEAIGDGLAQRLQRQRPKLHHRKYHLLPPLLPLLFSDSSSSSSSSLSLHDAANGGEGGVGGRSGDA